MQNIRCHLSSITVRTTAYCEDWSSIVCNDYANRSIDVAAYLCFIMGYNNMIILFLRRIRYFDIFICNLMMTLNWVFLIITEK